MGNPLRRARLLVRVAVRITALNFRAQLEYRANFLLAVVEGIAWQTSVLVFASILATRFTAFGDWTTDGVLLVAGLRMLSHALYTFVFRNVQNLGDLVQYGRVEGYLVRPVPVYFQVLFSALHLSTLGDLAVGLGLLVTAVSRVDIVWTAGKVGYLLLALLGGALLEAAIQTALSCAAFRFPAARAWSTWVDELMITLGVYPLDILPSLLRGVLTFVLPLAFIAYLPAAVLAGRTGGLGVPGVVALLSPLLGLLAFVAAIRLWRWSLRHYNGIGG